MPPPGEERPNTVKKTDPRVIFNDMLRDRLGSFILVMHLWDTTHTILMGVRLLPPDAPNPEKPRVQASLSVMRCVFETVVNQAGRVRELIRYFRKKGIRVADLVEKPPSLVLKLINRVCKLPACWTATEDQEKKTYRQMQRIRKVVLTLRQQGIITDESE